MKKILKAILSEQIIWKIVSLKEKINLLIIKLNINFYPLIMFSLFFSRKYYLEHKSFLTGSYIYRKALLNNNKLNVHFIRRNIHRIEKGLIMKPRRKVFALRFILETVKAVNVLYESKSESSELKWAIDVLNKYFQIVASGDNNFTEAKLIFDKISFNSLSNVQEEIPYAYNNVNLVSYNDFKNLAYNRKSVRWYSPKLVENSKIKKALEVAALSPSSCNRSPYRYIICNGDRAKVNKISSISAGTVGWNHNIPAIAVLIGKNRAFPNLENRHSIYFDSTLSVMPFILSLECQGLSTCLINWADIPEREKKISDLLDLEPDEKVIMSISIGYAEKESMVAFSKRKSINEISKFI